MKTWRLSVMAAVVSMWVALSMTECGGGGDGNDETSIDGTWGFLLNFVNARMTLHEEDGVIGGTFEWVGQSALATAATSVTGTITETSASITIVFANNTVTTISATLGGDNLTGGATTQSPGSAVPQVQDFSATREGDSQNQNQGGQYTGTQVLNVTCCVEGHCGSSGPQTAPFVLVVGSDGRVMSTGPTMTVSQTGSSFTVTMTGGEGNLVYSGTINGDTITGTIGGDIGAGSGCSYSGTFSLTKSG